MYITIDIETAGNFLGLHSALSVGACVVTREKRTFSKYFIGELVFYAELQPTSLKYDIEAMRVGASHLKCLEGLKDDPRYDGTKREFDPLLVLKYMQRHCERPSDAAIRFKKWILRVSGAQSVEGVTDTVFFDSGYLNLWLGTDPTSKSPFGWKGLDLDSLYRGFTGRVDAKLNEIQIADPRKKPHRADEDAVFIAMIARELLYTRLRW